MHRLEATGIRCAQSVYDPIVTVKKDADGYLYVLLSSEIDGAELHYTFASANPDTTYPTSHGPLYLPKNAGELRIVASRNGKQIGQQLIISLAELKSRLGETCKLYKD
jgi:hexosaminidase